MKKVLNLALGIITSVTIPDAIHERGFPLFLVPFVGLLVVGQLGKGPSV